MNIYDRDKIRYNLLVELYRVTEGDVKLAVDLSILGNHLQLNSNEVEKAYYYLKDEGYIDPYGMGLSVTLSHDGIKIVESFLRKLDFDENKKFNSNEIYQLRIILNEIKEQIEKLHLGQEIIFNQIEETFEQSKIKSKQEWKEYFEEQIKEWSSQKIIDYSAQIIMQGLLVGLKINP